MEKVLPGFFRKSVIFAAMKRAIIIGLNYTGEQYALPDCEIDADTMERLLKAAGVQTTVIKGECSPEWLMAHLLNVEATRMRKSDTLYLYYSGHGTQFPDKTEEGGVGEALCLYDKRHGQIMLLKDNDLVAAIDRIPGTKIIILDSCFSGGMDREAAQPGLRRKSVAYDPDKMILHTSGITRDVFRFAPQYFLFACEEQEVSYSTGDGGMFTLSLLSARRSGITRVSALIKAARKICGNSQTPHAVDIGGSGAKKVL